VAETERPFRSKSKVGFVSIAAARYSKKQTFAAYEIRLPASGSYGLRIQPVDATH